ncbi:sirohydrochlorin cobaltochelatase [Selenomonas ruminis]|uniref:Cobalt chelatase n=1 Tax=Selenomonas ruminis TaxID=2593411 RepID=A0A5D6W0H8_9FIRM|nr:sirohydrochlorin cobaltochelatase [Selenomonas sp. mPRGC5]TYZ21416.1 cobalt chelatase [Selenomonas sp. mPRGC5]
MSVQKQALVFASFGVSDRRAREASLDAAEALLAERFPAFAVFSCYTSNFIRKRLAGQGINIPSLPDLLASLAEQGYSRVLVQPSHLTPGEEFDGKVLKAVEEARTLFPEGILVGRPVFDSADDYQAVLAAILPELSLAAGEQLVLFGHGSPHHHNPVYERLQQVVDERHLPVHVGVLEPSDTPNLPMVISRLKQSGAQQVLLAPLLLAGGSHVTRDMAGDDESSWKSQLTAAGFTVRMKLQGLGEYLPFRELYAAKAKKALENSGWLK